MLARKANAAGANGSLLVNHKGCLETHVAENVDVIFGASLQPSHALVLEVSLPIFKERPGDSQGLVALRVRSVGTDDEIGKLRVITRVDPSPLSLRELGSFDLVIVQLDQALVQHQNR